MIKIAARRVILPEGPPRAASLTVQDGRIAGISEGSIAADALDLGDMILAPGLVDLHGDAFERQLMPRPGVMVDPTVAMLDTDRQLAAQGITTAFHGITWSWEPGLRSDATAISLIDTLGRARAADALRVNHLAHLRLETFHLDGFDRVVGLIAAGHVGLLAFNDHTAGMARQAGSLPGNHALALRAMVPRAEFDELARAAHARAQEVDGHIDAVAAACRAARVPMLSHDDESPAQRDRFRSIGARICEFPKNHATAAHARAMGDAVVMGAPNVVRGRSHLGWLSASEAVQAGLCSALASDYWYPSLLQAPFQLARRGSCSLPDAWRLVAAGPSAIAGLADRGALAPGKRADLVAIDDRGGLPPRAVGTWVAGRRILIA